MNNPLCSFTVRGIQLHIIYDKEKMGLYQLISSNSRMNDYVHNSTEKALYDAVYEVSPNEYCLNIASTENFNYLDLEYEAAFLESQLEIFMPLVQKFMVYALTGKLSNRDS